MKPALGVSGRVAAYFQAAQITPLLALVALLLGVFAVFVTPREEEPNRSCRKPLTGRETASLLKFATGAAPERARGSLES